MKDRTNLPEPHLTDQELLMAADGELDAPRAAEVHAHLEACWSCRARARALEQTVADFVDAHHASVPIPPPDGPRAMLRARLAQDLNQPDTSLLQRASTAMLVGYRMAYAGATFALIVVALFSWGLYRDSQIRGHLTPNPNLTPGAVATASPAQVCSAADGAPHMIPAALSRQIFSEYGIGNPQPRSYEIDYLIAPELGGSEDPRNLWPQPYSAPGWNSRVKDALEDRLHTLVCQNKISLDEAQQAIAKDWIGAYKKYFATNRPLENHMVFAKDMPWE